MKRVATPRDYVAKTKSKFTNSSSKKQKAQGAGSGRSRWLYVVVGLVLAAIAFYFAKSPSGATRIAGKSEEARATNKNAKSAEETATAIIPPKGKSAFDFYTMLPNDQVQNVDAKEKQAADAAALAEQERLNAVPKPMLTGALALAATVTDDGDKKASKTNTQNKTPEMDVVPTEKSQKSVEKINTEVAQKEKPSEKTSEKTLIEKSEKSEKPVVSEKKNAEKTVEKLTASTVKTEKSADSKKQTEKTAEPSPARSEGIVAQLKRKLRGDTDAEEKQKTTKSKQGEKSERTQKTEQARSEDGKNIRTEKTEKSTKSAVVAGSANASSKKSKTVEANNENDKPFKFDPEPAKLSKAEKAAESKVAEQKTAETKKSETKVEETSTRANRDILSKSTQRSTLSAAEKSTEKTPKLDAEPAKISKQESTQTTSSTSNNSAQSASTESTPKADNPSKRYMVQAAAFPAKSDAERVKAGITLLGMNPKLDTATTDGMKRHRVRLGPFKSRESAEAALQKLKDNGFGGSVKVVN